MSANHADGCPAIADTRDGCSCLLRGVAAQGEHDRMCPVYVAMPENQCGYCYLIARVRKDEQMGYDRGWNDGAAAMA